MEAVQQPAKREWPKWLWGPDGLRARFDSPSDVPRDYTEEKPPPRSHHEPAPAHPAIVAVDAALRATIKQVLGELLDERKAESLAKARAAKQKG